MNEKLTPEQRDWIMRLVETHLPETMGRQIVREALTALTPEDERHDCIKHLRQLGWNVTEPAEYDGLTGKYLKGDLSKANPVAIKPKTEDVCAECGGRGWIGRPPHVALYDTTCPQCQTDAIYCRHSTAKQQGG